MAPTGRVLLVFAFGLILASACWRRPPDSAAVDTPTARMTPTADLPSTAAPAAAADEAPAAAADGLPAFQYTRAITLERRPGYTLVTIDPGARRRWRFRYAFVPRGQAAVVGERDAAIVEVPVRRIVVEVSNGLQQYVDDLGAGDTVVGITHFGGVYPWLTRLHQRRLAGALVQVDSGEEINLERVLDLQPDLVLSDFAGGGGSLWPVLRRGVSGIAMAPRLERHPLASAEWIKLLGLLLDRQAEAEARFSRIEARYRDLARRAAAAPERPRVLPMRLNAGEVWTDRDVIRQIVVDAGGQPLPSAPDVWTYYYEYPYEVILDQGLDADVWPFARFSSKTIEDVIEGDARLAAFRPIREARVFHPNGRMQPRLIDPYYSAIYLYPDAILADLVSIFHPDVLPDHECVYFRAIRRASE